MHTKKNNNLRNNHTLKSTKKRLCILKNGLGNKIFILANILNEYKDYKIYFYEEKSPHQLIDPEVISEIFPKIQSISKKEYDEMKEKGIPEIYYHRDIYFNIKGFIEQKEMLKKLLKINDKYNYLLNKYDFKNGIFVHIRYGDKLNYNWWSTKMKQGYIFPLFKPAYYIDSVKKLLKPNPTAPVYIFSDSKKIVKCLIQKELPQAQIVDEGTVESFFCFKNCNNLILSDSTISQSAVLLSNNKNMRIIYPYYTTSYTYKHKQLKSLPMPMINFHSLSKNTISEKDEKYLLNKFEDINKIIKKCDIPIKNRFGN